MVSSKMPVRPAQPPAVLFSFRIGLWPIGSRRRLDDDEPIACVDIEMCWGAPGRAGGRPSSLGAFFMQIGPKEGCWGKFGRVGARSTFPRASSACKISGPHIFAAAFGCVRALSRCGFRMPRYFFHMSEGLGRTSDHEGSHYRSVEEAREGAWRPRSSWQLDA
jgi:hypothetical protein